MHELCRGCVELACDAKKALELFQAGRGRGDADDAAALSKDTVVLCCFDGALAHVRRWEEGDGATASTSAAPFTSTGMMIEVPSLECAMSITETACKLLECALTTNPQNVAPLVTSELLFALSRLLVIQRQGNDHIFAHIPVRWGRNGHAVGCLKGIQCSQNLGKVTPY